MNYKEFTTRMGELQSQKRYHQDWRDRRGCTKFPHTSIINDIDNEMKSLHKQYVESNNSKED